jgi:hypothetical protein
MERSDFSWNAAMMKKFPQLTAPGDQEGKAGYILLWLLGVPIPILFLIFLLRGCN